MHGFVSYPPRHTEIEFYTTADKVSLSSNTGVIMPYKYAQDKG